ncbi:hypothetical protein OAF09_00070 [bacterium]|nr:hypothetical protein [bacterium]
MTHRFPTQRARITGSLFLIFGLGFGLSSLALGETWTSLRGNYVVEAEMLGLWGEAVILKMDDGRRVSVNLLNLRSESRIQAREIAKKLEEQRDALITELKGRATDAAAPAPDPLPQPPAASAYVPPQPNAKAGDFLNQVENALASGHLLGLYDSLPPSYRKDIDELVKLTAANTNSAAWTTVMGTFQKFGEVLVTRQRWFLSSPRIQALGPAEQDFISGPVITLAGLLRTGLDPAAMQLQTLQTADFRQWLEQRDEAIAPYLSLLMQQLGLDSLRQMNVESEQDGVAVVSVSAGGESFQDNYVQVEGYWVSKSLADQWSEEVETWKQTAQTPDAMDMTTASIFLGTLQPVLGQLANTQDASGFHEQMEAIFLPAESMMTTLAGSLGTTFAGNNAGQSANGRGAGGGEFGDYGEGMEMDMEMEMDMDMDMDMEMEMEMEERGPGGSSEDF